MHYGEYIPSAFLQQYVDCYWLHRLENWDDNFRAQSCLPLGTVELIVQADQNHSHHLNRNNVWEKSQRVFFAGLYEHSVTWKVAPGSVMFGIRLKPESLIKLFRFPVSSLINVIGDAESLLDPWIKSMGEEICGHTNPAPMVAIAEKYLQKRLSAVTDNELRFETACRLLRSHPKDLTIEGLSEQLSIGRRQLERIFKDQMGTSPKTYQRIVRFTHAYRDILQNENPAWTDLTYNHGFADQSHFIRDFKEFAGELPSEFIARTQPFAPKQLSIDMV